MTNKLLSVKRDPVGDVYQRQGKILRGIRAEFADYYLNIYHHPKVQAMFGSKIIETCIAKNPLPRYAITLEHPLITPQNYCYEWPMAMLRDAALLTLDICIELSSMGAILKDASPWNIIFRGPHPIMIDFNSIMPEQEHLLWVAYYQFICQFLFPMLVGHFTLGKTTRAIMLASQNGVTPDEIGHFLPLTALIRIPWLFNRLYLPKLMMSLFHSSRQEKEVIEYQRKIHYSSQSRRTFFSKLRRDIYSIQYVTNGSQWSKYYDDINKFFEPENFHLKQQTLAKLIDQTKPSTVVDIGCNLGGYSILAARSGSKVVAFDTDEDSVTMLYRLAKEKMLDILPIVSDVLYPATQSGLRGEEYQSSKKRFRSKMALALALVHHLAITQNQSFEWIVPILSDYCEKYLITEFIPLSDSRAKELLLTSNKDMSWYSIEAFLHALNKEFKTTSIFPSYPTGRTLCFCEKY